jgi:magnesium-transporting ATPase (P-type)
MRRAPRSCSSWMGLANPLVLILLAASVVSGIVGEALDAAIIVTIVLLSVGLDFFQSFRSEQAATRLQGLVALTARVWRDAKLTDIPLREVVPGDILELRAGDLLPADANVLAAVTLSVDQAALTGEPLPVEKRVGEGPGSQLFAGTSVVSGMGRAEVTTTGAHTQFGAIAHALVEKAPPTEYERGARSFGLLIMRTVVGLVLLVFLISAVSHHDALQSLLFALALAVGLTPEFLPMIITVTLAAGRGRARACHGADGRPEGPRALTQTVAAIKHLLAQVVSVLHAQRPATQPVCARVPGADVILPRPPQRHLLTRLDPGDHLRFVAEPRRRPVDGITTLLGTR